MRGCQLSRSKSASVDAKVFHLCSVKTLCGSPPKRNYIKPAVALSKDQLLVCSLTDLFMLSCGSNIFYYSFLCAQQIQLWHRGLTLCCFVWHRQNCSLNLGLRLSKVTCVNQKKFSRSVSVWMKAELRLYNLYQAPNSCNTKNIFQFTIYKYIVKANQAGSISISAQCVYTLLKAEIYVPKLWIAQQFC